MTRESDLDYFRARFYNPRLGRFMSPDPSNAGADPGNPQSWNAYAYVLDNPATDIDPSGLCTVDGESHNWLWCAEYAVGSSFEGSVDDNQGLDQLLSETAALRARWERGVFVLSPPPAPYRIGSSPKQSKQGKKSLPACASDAAQSVSIAADLHHVPGLKKGVGGFVANALFSNTISAATDLGTSFFTGEGGGHNVFYNMALAETAGPTQGFAPLFGNAIKGTPWAASPVDVLWAKLGEYGVGIGEANLTFSFITYGLSLGSCAAGWVQ